MSLRRVDTTFDLTEAHIVVGLLRAEGIDAYLFDADFVRQNWLKAIAFGGYRILVRDADVSTARGHIRTYRDTKTTLSHSDDAPCPSCSSTAYRDDPRPRRWVFAIYTALQLVPLAIFMKAGTSAARGLVAGFMLTAADTLLALAAIFYVKRRYVCDLCGYRWRDRLPYRYSSLNEAHVAASGPPD